MMMMAQIYAAEISVFSAGGIVIVGAGGTVMVNVGVGATVIVGVGAGGAGTATVKLAIDDHSLATGSSALTLQK